MTLDANALQSALAELVGAHLVRTDEAALLSHSHDYWLLDMQRRMHGVRPDALPSAVVQPASHDDVVKLVRFAAANSLALVPFGLGSGVCGGARPVAGAIVLDMSALNRIVSLNETALTVTVQAGMRGGEFERQLNERGYSMGHFPQSLHLSSVGGWVATRASGQFSSKYGSIEDMVVSLKAVLPDATTVSTRDVPRSSTGPDVRNLLIGSEGTLAVITEVTYKIHPTPAAQRGHAYMFPEFHQGLEAIRLITREGWKPALLRLYDRSEAKRHFGNAANGGCILLVLSEG
ncbi:MAG: FAD-binding oxidoreductase, partial [Terriglobales bacterium]